MRFLVRILAIASVGFVTSPAFAYDLPSTAKQASMDEFKALADGKTVAVEIFDAGVPVTGMLTWSWADETITGEALVNSKDKVNVSVKLLFEGDMVCSQAEGAEATCHTIHIDGDTFYEVTADGVVHAKSTLQN